MKSTPIARRTPLRSKGGRRFPESYVDEEYRDWIRGQMCVLMGEMDEDRKVHVCQGPVEQCHVLTQGSGALDAGNLYPGCKYEAHRLEGDFGWRYILERYGICLPEIAIRLYHKFLKQSGRLEN